jgi:hypothetical protein
MIKLFRNIRQNLLAEGKTTRYLKYAIGEIILVVIGILIALSINNWNTNHSNKKGEAFYLEKLHRNFEQDTLNLSRRLDEVESSLLALHSLKLEIADSSLQRFSKPQILYTLLGTYGFSPETSTFDNLIATGKLELIQNQSFVDSMFVYYNTLNNRVKQNNEGIVFYSRNTIGPYVLQFDDIENPQLKPITYSKKPFFRNVISIRKGQLSLLKKDYEKSIRRCKNLMNAINEQMKN